MQKSPEPTPEKNSKWRKLETYVLLFVAIFWLLIYLAFVVFMAIGAKRVGQPTGAPASYCSPASDFSRTTEAKALG